MSAVIECPRHNGRFDYTTGRGLGARADRPAHYPARVQGGTVCIEIG
jgi:3-phenylpropionate/trans-cinnamate dioxygenase ferredoxin subunit